MLVCCMNLNKIGNVLTSKFAGTGTSSCEKRIYPAAVSKRLRNNVLNKTQCQCRSLAAAMLVSSAIPPTPNFSVSLLKILTASVNFMLYQGHC
jgi:hypothetical protein